MPVAEEIPYLKPGCWLGNNSIDRYLLQHWHKVKDQSPMLYINTYHTILCSHHDSPSGEDCRSIRRALLLPEGGMVPMRPVAFVIYDHDSRHYFTVVMNYDLLHVTTYGHHITSEISDYAQDPEKWAGQNIWRNICIVFNWEIPAQKPIWWAIDWKQVSMSYALYIYIKIFDQPIRMELIVVQSL